MPRAGWLLVVAAAIGCRQSEPDPPERTLHLERWDGAGVPITGDITLTLTGLDPSSDLAVARGTIELVCDPCMLGDGVTRLKPENARSGSWGSEGITVPRIDLGMVRGTMRVAGGKGEMEVHVAGGTAIEVSMTGTIAFAPRLADSMVDTTWIVRPTADIQTGAAELATLLSLLGPTDPSGAVTVVMRGPLDRMRPVRPPR